MGRAELVRQLPEADGHRNIGTARKEPAQIGIDREENRDEYRPTSVTLGAWTQPHSKKIRWPSFSLVQANHFHFLV